MEQLQACFFECAAASQVITWVWPDCSRPQLWFPGVMMQALGYGPGDLEPDIATIAALVHPDDRASADRTIASIVTKGRVGDFESECRLRRKDGSYSRVRGLTSVVRRTGAPGVCAFGLARIIDADPQLESSVLKLTQDITAIKAQQAEQLAREKALTRTLVREVHHRIKNHLQGLVGLLRSYPASQHSAREAIDAAVAQILTIATVHGLLAKDGQTSIELADLVGQIIATLRVGSAIPLQFTVESSQWQPTALSQEEAVPLAAAIGELFTNAVKHTARVEGAYVDGRLSYDHEGMQLDIVNAPAKLPVGFSLTGSTGPHTGLALVRALLPRNRSHLEMFQDGDAVKTRLRLKLLTGRRAT